MKQSHKTLVLWVMLILMFVAIYNLVPVSYTHLTLPTTPYV